MSEIKIIYDLQRFTNEIDSLYQLIAEEQGRCLANYEHVGRTVPERISFEEIDLSPLKNRLLSVHKTLEYKGRFLSPQRARKARIIAIGGICELIKDGYVGKFWDLYRSHIGEDNRGFVYDKIWAKGFKESGIELIQGERREFVQTLVMESGVPKERTGDIISFFEIYWRYLRPMDVKEIISDLNENSYLSFRKVPRLERSKLKKLSENASEYTRAFVRAVDRLTAVFDFISESEKIHGGNVREFANEIFKGTGIHPFSFLRNHEQLELLYKKLLGYVTPSKFKKIIETKPPNTLITTPDGKKIKAHQYHNIIFGEHLLENALFFCVPDKNFDLKKLKSIQHNRIEKFGNSVLLKSNADIIPRVNSSLRNDLVNTFYFNKEKCGNIFYFRDISGCSIHLKTSDKKVNDFIYGDDGFSGNCFLMAEKKNDTISLHLKVKTLRLLCRGLRDKNILFKIPEYNLLIHEGRCDPTGLARCSERRFPIENPQPGNIEIQATKINKHGGDAPVFLSNGGKASILECLDDVMLFHAGSGYRIRPKKAGQGYSIGGDSFFLFCSEAVLQKRVRKANLRIEKSIKYGKYFVSLIVWKDTSLPCSFSIENNIGDNITWKFEKCVNFNIWVEKKKKDRATHLKFNGYQGQHPNNFELKIYPFPSIEYQKTLFWSISLNDCSPYIIEVGNCCQDEHKKSCFYENYLSELLMPVWSGQKPSNTKVEIALCTLDFVFSMTQFYLLPDIAIKLPEAVRLNDEFKIKVLWGENQKCQDVLLKNRRGRSLVTAGFQFKNNSWQIFKKRHISDFLIPDVDTVVRIEAEQPLRSILLGNRERLYKERLRDLKVTELAEYDLLVVEPGNNIPSVSVNGIAYNDSFVKNDFGVWSLPLGAMPGLNQFQNSIIINAGDESSTFNIFCPMTIRNICFDDSLFCNALSGKCSFAGPNGSEIVIRVYPEKDKKEDIFLEKKYVAPGMQDVDIDFSLDLPVFEEFLPDQLFVSVFYSNEKGGLIEYEKSFCVSSERHLCKTKFHKIKQRIDQDLKEHKTYSAKRLLELAAPYVPGFQEKWFNVQWNRVWGEYIRKTLDSAASQITTILKENYLIDFTGDEYNGKK